MPDCTTRSAIAAFFEVKDLVLESFGVRSAAELVAAVHDGVQPRRGVCVNGWEYFVHGAGYTVVAPGGAQVHIDDDDSRDIFSVYDIRFYLDGLGCLVSDLESIRRECEGLVETANLVRVDKGRFALVNPLDHVL